MLRLKKIHPLKIQQAPRLGLPLEADSLEKTLPLKHTANTQAWAVFRGRFIRKKPRRMFVGWLVLSLRTLVASGKTSPSQVALGLSPWEVYMHGLSYISSPTMHPTIRECRRFAGVPYLGPLLCPWYSHIKKSKYYHPIISSCAYFLLRSNSFSFFYSR